MFVDYEVEKEGDRDGGLLIVERDRMVEYFWGIEVGE